MSSILSTESKVDDNVATSNQLTLSVKSVSLLIIPPRPKPFCEITNYQNNNKTITKKLHNCHRQQQQKNFLEILKN